MSAEGHRVAVYYQTQYDSSLAPKLTIWTLCSPLPLLTLITHLFLAAFHINTDKSVHLNDNDLGEMQAQGIKVIGMLGGSSPGTYSLLTPANFDTYYPILRDYIAEFHLDGMDLDVEQATPMSDIEHLITQLKADFGDDFIITLAPVASALLEGSNLSGFDYGALDKAMGAQIAWYNAQVVASVLTSPDNGNGYVDIDEVISSAKALSAKYGFNFGGINGTFNSLPDSTQPQLWAEEIKGAMANLTAAKREFEAGKRSEAWALSSL
ncbi:endo-beta-N-acetylglucosaminidase [Mycena olivaceomarginata]|nr:endo-beta-N-acetylglucosaminidase [Mycena olivaceomarginata]